MLNNEFLRWLQDSALGLLVRKSDHLVGAAIQVFHITGLILLLTAVLVMTLRLFGQGLRRPGLSELNQALLPIFLTGIVSIVASGILMFIGNAVIYYANPAFQYKMSLFVLAIFTQSLLFYGLSRKPIWPTLALKVAALGSFGLWLAVGLAGRAIGFV